jgi:hypothetical protein
VKLSKIVDHFLDGGLKVVDIKGSDVIGVAKMYADRAYPVRPDGSGPTNYSFIQINMGDYRADPQPAPPGAPEVDITPAPVGYTTRGIESPREKTDAGILNEIKGPEVR